MKEGPSGAALANAHGTVLRLAIAGLFLASPSLAQESFRVVVGYTSSAVQEVYVEDGKRVVKTMMGSYLQNVDPAIQTELLAFADSREMKEAIEGKRVDLVGGASNQVFEMAKDGGLEPAMVTELDGGVYDDAVLLVKKDAGFANLVDLQGKRLMILEGAESGHHYLWLDTWTLREGRQTVESLFGSVRQGRTSSQVILACFFSSAEACLVPRGAFELAIELNPQIGERLRVLGRSAGLVGAIVAFRAEFNPSQRARVIDLMTGMHDHPRGQQLLKLFRRNRLVPFKPEYLAGIAALVREHDERAKARRASGGGR